MPRTRHFAKRRFNNTLGSMDAEELVDTMSNTLTKAVVLFKALANTLA